LCDSSRLSGSRVAQFVKWSSRCTCAWTVTSRNYRLLGLICKVNTKSRAKTCTSDIPAMVSHAGKSVTPRVPAETRMVSSGMLSLVALVGTDVSEELSVSFNRVTRIGGLETTLAVTNNRRTLRRRVTRRNIPEDASLQKTDVRYEELCLLGCYAVWLL
jgi:hypothetical protein